MVLAFVLVIETVAGLLLAVIGWMGLKRTLPPNPLAGIRTSYTFSSAEAWYETHEAGGPILVLGGVALVAIGLALLPFALTDNLPVAAVLTGVIVQGVIAAIAAVGSWVYGVRKAKAKLDVAPSTGANGAPNAS